MSIKKQYYFMCDDCGDSSEAYDSFVDLKDESYKERWRSKKDQYDEWGNYCPDCE